MKEKMKKTKPTKIFRTIQILKIIGKSVVTTGQILTELFPTPYESYREMMNLSPRYRQFKSKADWQEYKHRLIKQKELQRFYNLLSTLKKQGFVERPEKGFWKITSRGKARIKKFFIDKKHVLPEAKYKQEKSDEFKIIVFDIPEEEKRKRNWLRAVLKRLGFKMLQKSVWIGKIKLPEEFINDLRKLNLLDCVEILAITKTGSLRHME